MSLSLISEAVKARFCYAHYLIEDFNIYFDVYLDKSDRSLKIPLVVFCKDIPLYYVVYSLSPAIHDDVFSLNLDKIYQKSLSFYLSYFILTELSKGKELGNFTSDFEDTLEHIFFDFVSKLNIHREKLIVSFKDSYRDSAIISNISSFNKEKITNLEKVDSRLEGRFNILAKQGFLFSLDTNNPSDCRFWADSQLGKTIFIYVRDKLVEFLQLNLSRDGGNSMIKFVDSYSDHKFNIFLKNLEDTPFSSVSGSIPKEDSLTFRDKEITINKIIKILNKEKFKKDDFFSDLFERLQDESTSIDK